MHPSRILLLALLCTALTAFAADSPRKIAFERDNKIWVANLDGSAAKKVGAGILPDISHDGSRVAFITEESSGKTGWARHIAIAEAGSDKTTLFKDVPSENVTCPKWSPDDGKIVFTLYDGHNWHVAMINADGSGFRYVKKSKGDADMMNSPCWAPDGKSLFAQDMKSIYRLGLDGAVLEHWEIEKNIPNGDMSGDGRIDVSPDGKKLLLGIDMNEEAHRKEWDGPLPATWVFDMESKKATRITPKKLFGWDGCWVDDSTVLILSQAVGEKSASIYKMAVTGGALSKPVAKGGARQPSVSR
jgi:TolB protein